LSAFEFRQLIVKPCAEVADLPAAIAGGLLGQSQPIDNLLRQMAGVIRLPFCSTTARTSGTVITIIFAVMGDDLADMFGRISQRCTELPGKVRLVARRRPPVFP
jgi:hypothetical protein